MVNGYCYCRLPEDIRLWPSVGNGHISMVAHSENVSMNGLYNGFMNTSHRAAIPCPLSANVTGINNRDAVNRTYILNTKAGTVSFTYYNHSIDRHMYFFTCNWYSIGMMIFLRYFAVFIHWCCRCLSRADFCTRFKYYLRMVCSSYNSSAAGL